LKPILIDINCDVGEGQRNELSLFPIISSCNIACGGHAGDAHSILEIAALAAKYNVKIGAHPSYPDKENFGRTVMNISEKNLQNSIKEQIAFFLKIISNEAIRMHHIKPHGALYNQIAKNNKLATVFLQAIEAYKEDTFLYVPYKSAIEKEALRAGFKIKYEAFCDRNYKDNLTLVSRKKSDSLIKNPKEVLKHILPIIKDTKIKTISGKTEYIKADTFCIHGDTENCIEILMYLSHELLQHNIQISK